MNIAHLTPQLKEVIADRMSEGWTHEELAKSIQSPYHWTESRPFRLEKFNYEGAEFTINQLCNIVEMLTGSDTKFAETLRLHVVSLLNVEYEQEVTAEEAQREYVWSSRQSIDRESEVA